MESEPINERQLSFSASPVGEGAQLPLISVVIPVRNSAPMIQGVLESVLKVKFPRDSLEVIVVDNGSHDGTSKVVGGYPVKLVQEPRVGINFARNSGVAASRGGIVAFTDADCMVDEAWAAELLGSFGEVEVAVVGGSVEPANPDNLYARYTRDSIIPIMPVFTSTRMSSTIRPGRYPPGCNMAFRRDLLKKIGLFDVQFNYGYDEVDAYERVIRLGYKILCEPKVRIRHFHRSSLATLLRQQFRYGKGQALFRSKHPESVLSRRMRLALTAFLGGHLLTGLGLLLNSWFLLAPAVFYLSGTALYRKLGKAKWRDSLLFPGIDYLRFLALLSGDLASTVGRLLGHVSLRS